MIQLNVSLLNSLASPFSKPYNISSAADTTEYVRYFSQSEQEAENWVEVELLCRKENQEKERN